MERDNAGHGQNGEIGFNEFGLDTNQDVTYSMDQILEILLKNHGADDSEVGGLIIRR